MAKLGELKWTKHLFVSILVVILGKFSVNNGVTHFMRETLWYVSQILFVSTTLTKQGTVWHTVQLVQYRLEQMNPKLSLLLWYKSSDHNNNITHGFGRRSLKKIALFL